MTIKFKDIAIIGSSVGVGYCIGVRKGAKWMRDKIIGFLVDVVTESEKNEKMEEES